MENTIQTKFDSGKNEWNIIVEKDFKQMIHKVFSNVANVLQNTLGPYGSTTVIEKFGECHITKDGWTVLKNIHFSDKTYNNILMMLTRICAQVVIKVGDGSTTSIIAAGNLYDNISWYENEFNLRPKEFMDVFNSCINKVIEYIYNNAKSVDKNKFDDIYKLAYISTNGDSSISNIIKDIYIKTNNPAIQYVKSNTNETRYEIINGYRNNITYLDRIFITNDDGICNIEHPYILLFDHKIDIDKALPIISNAASLAAENNTRLVVVAPYYDRLLLEHIRRSLRLELETRGTSLVVYCRIPLVNNISHHKYNDFSILCGAGIISEQFIDTINSQNVSDYIGSVEHMSISENSTFIKGFVRRNDYMYNKAIEDATFQYNKSFQENQKRSIVDLQLNELKQRLSELKCNMGIIYVGGSSELEKTANFDLVEDAVKAAESAYVYGYNIGGSLIIPYVVNKILANESINYNEKVIYNIIKESFIDVFLSIYNNKYPDQLNDPTAKITILEQINQCTSGNLSEPECFDIITEKFTKDIINSCQTDIEILKATSSIISLLITSNQYISLMQ